MAPVSTVYHTNDVVFKYSPAVFKEAVIKATEDMTQGKEYSTDKLNIKVTKVRLTKDASGEAKVDSLITMEISLKKNPGFRIKQQVHVYYTSQSIMVQGNRLLSGVKGFKLLVEEFLQPKMTTEIQAKTKDIAETKNKLDVVFEDTKNKAEKQ